MKYINANEFLPVRLVEELQKNNVWCIENNTVEKFCSIACGAKFLFNSANHTLTSLSTYPFPLFFEEWGDKKNVAKSWERLRFVSSFFR